MLYFFLRSILRFLLKILFRYQVTGQEHIPQQGSAILCPNHISNLDPPIVGCAATRVIHFMAKEELFRFPPIGWLLKRLHAFPVNRQGGGTKALKQSIKVLRGNGILGIFPEGTRSKTGELTKARNGAALLSVKTGAPIIPTAIIGPYRLFRPVHIVFGKPILPNDFENTSSNQVQSITNSVMDEIESLLVKHREDHHK